MRGKSRGKGAAGLQVLAQNAQHPIQRARSVRNHSAMSNLLKYLDRVALLFFCCPSGPVGAVHTQHPGPAGHVGGPGRLSENNLGMEHTPAPRSSSKMVVAYLGIQRLIFLPTAPACTAPLGGGPTAHLHFHGCISPSHQTPRCTATESQRASYLR